MNKLLLDYYRNTIKQLKRDTYTHGRELFEIEKKYRKTKEWNDMMDKLIKQVEAL